MQCLYLLIKLKSSDDNVFYVKNSVIIKIITNAEDTAVVAHSKRFFHVRFLQCFIQSLQTMEENKLQAQSFLVYFKSWAFTGLGHA